MAVISQLSVSLKANIKPLSRGLTRAKRQVKNFTKNVVNMKTAIIGALGVGGVGAALNSSLAAWKTQEQAMASLAATNQSMGRSAAGLTDDMIKLASQLQREGIIGDEAIIQGMSFLSTYSQIPDELLPRATRAMVDLMAKTGMSGQNAANLIGKAAMGLAGSLRIAGITLSEDTEKAVKLDKEMKKMAENAGVNLRGLTDNGKTFKLMLRDIESQVGGTNKALAATDTGAFDQLSNSLGDIKEKIGGKFAKSISKWVRQLSKDIDENRLSVDGLTNSFKKWSIESMLSIAPVVESFKGIQLVIKTLKLGFLGFGALVTGTLRNIAERVQSFADIFGLDIKIESLGFLDESYRKQLANIESLKAELGSLTEEIANRTFSKSLEAKLREFDQRATVTEAGIKGTSKPQFKPLSNSDRITLGSVTATEVSVKDAPQIDQTNDLLRDIKRNLSYTQYAVAG